MYAASPLHAGHDPLMLQHRRRRPRRRLPAITAVTAVTAATNAGSCSGGGCGGGCIEVEGPEPHPRRAVLAAARQHLPAPGM